MTEIIVSPERLRELAQFLHDVHGMLPCEEQRRCVQLREWAGTALDAVVAEEWFAGYSGLEEIMFCLGSAVDETEGVDRELVTAWKWFREIDVTVLQQLDIACKCNELTDMSGLNDTLIGAAEEEMGVVANTFHAVLHGLAAELDRAGRLNARDE